MLSTIQDLLYYYYCYTFRSVTLIKLTKDGRLFVGTDVVEGLVKKQAQFVSQDGDKGFHVLFVHQTV